MMKRKGVIRIAMIALCMAAFGGCGKQEQTVTDNGGKEPVTLDWYVNYSWFVTGWGENLVSRTITEETGVSVNFITPRGNEQEKLNALISSDSLPDLITLGWWEPQVTEMIDKNMVYPLNELADTYDMLFYEVTDPDVRNWYTRDDGNIYCYPNSSYTPSDLEEHDNIPMNQTFLVRKDIYEALGKPDMTTPEGFYDAVVRAKELYPEVNGEPLIPIGSHVFDDMGCVSFDKYLQNFLAVPYEKDGKYYDRYTDPEYLRWLKLFRQLGEEGYLAPDIFVDTRTQMSEKIAEGRYFCMLYQRTDLADQEKALYAGDPEKIYIAVDGPKNSKGDDPVLPSPGISGWTVTLISKKCKDPERAMEFLDYLISEEGQKMVYLGIEGITYDMVDGKPVIREDVKKLLNTDRLEYDRLYGADDCYWMLQNNVMQLKWQPELEEPLKQLAEWTYPYARYTAQYDALPDDNTELGQIKTKVDRLWSETLKELLLAPTEEDFDEIWENFKEERQNLGYDRVMEEQTKRMEENKLRLGIQ
jgi:putative aldouronate transport system substrate-binding protein